MLFAYVDESYDRSRHWVAAVLIDHRLINDTALALTGIVAEAADSYGIPADAELHGNPLYQASGDFVAMREMRRARIGIYRGALECIAAAPCAVILRGVDRAGLERRYAIPDPPHRVTMGHLIERIDEHCASVGDQALIVADEHHEMESTLLRDLQIFRQQGTWGYRKRRIEHVVDTIHFVRSSTNPLIQAADLVAFLGRRYVGRTETDPRAQAANEHIWKAISGCCVHKWCWYPSQI